MRMTKAKLNTLFEELRLLNDSYFDMSALNDKLLDVQSELFPDMPVKHIPIPPGSGPRHVAILSLAIEALAKDLPEPSP